jgi:hypothetical protein
VTDADATKPLLERKTSKADEERKTSSKDVSALSVIDVTGVPVMGISGADVAEKDVGWLRRRLQHHLASQLQQPVDLNEIYLYQHYGDWLDDDTKLVSLPGQQHETLAAGTQLVRPHAGQFAHVTRLVASCCRYHRLFQALPSAR